MPVQRRHQKLLFLRFLMIARVILLYLRLDIKIQEVARAGEQLPGRLPGWLCPSCGVPTPGTCQKAVVLVQPLGRLRPLEVVHINSLLSQRLELRVVSLLKDLRVPLALLQVECIDISDVLVLSSAQPISGLKQRRLIVELLVS